ncbi:MAG TPA: long-chain fatty acid--CoA ligase [Bdellovibrionota bacterium]|nr:long-chain fatty acid--CoA ligase [Bdellovibrionota bacterium]
MGFILRSTVGETFLARVTGSPDRVAFHYKPKPLFANQAATWKRVTFSEFYLATRNTSFGLMKLGVAPGDKVALLSNTRYEWPLCDIAILGARGITVPIYASNTLEDIKYIINHSESKILIVEDMTQLKKLFAKQSSDKKAFPNLKKIVLIDPPVSETFTETPFGEVILLDSLKKLGHENEGRSPAHFSDNLNAAKPSDLLTICYTSGTTSQPKGAMITHENMMSVLGDCVESFGKHVTPEHEILLSFLPFSHILGKVESMAIYAFGWQEAFAESVDQLMSNVREIRPTIIFAVPRIFEKAYNLISNDVASSPSAYRKLFNWATHVGAEYFGAIHAKKSPSVGKKAEYILARNLIFKAASDRFGGRLNFAICGGAPLPREIGEFSQIIGLRILEGYGLTETCGPITLNTPGQTRFGSVGRPMPEVNIRIASDGEILVKSKKVFMGYYKMAEETAECLKDGWFHTGDIGILDPEGFVRITDRKKDIIITSGGKNIAPLKIEQLVAKHSLIEHFAIHGNGRTYLTALITLNKGQTIQYANENRILFSEYSELIKHPRILSLVQKILDEANLELASYETIKKFMILPNEFTIEGGELTPSLKLRRKFIDEHYKPLLDTMYPPAPPPPQGVQKRRSGRLLTKPKKLDT